ncbi:MAG TPA: hypothetical protein DHW63_11655 [Hyphomonadaceae bacterium]|nr:hypothetical protein [Hyphomonadaceae bacterium]
MLDDKTPRKSAATPSGVTPTRRAPTADEGTDIAKTKPQAPQPFGEMPRSIWVVFLAIWCVFFVALLSLFGGRADVLFNLGVVLALGVMYFGVPFVMLHVTRTKTPPAPTRYIDTANGRMSQREVLAQIILIPVLVTVAIMAIGWIALHT